VTGGAISFQVSYDGTNWVTVAADQVLDPASANLAQISLPYTLVASTNKTFLILPHGAQGLRIILTTAITGTATLTPYYALSGTPGVYEVIDPANTAANPDYVAPGTGQTFPIGPPPAAARNTPGCTVGTSSAQCLAASTAVSFLQLQNTSASANIACNIVGGTAVLNSSTSVQLGAGQSASWGEGTGGVPSGAINCIASAASTPLYVEWK
jgi:hypothetical protein